MEENSKTKRPRIENIQGLRSSYEEIRAYYLKRIVDDVTGGFTYGLHVFADWGQTLITYRALELKNELDMINDLQNIDGIECEEVYKLENDSEKEGSE